MRRGAVLAGFLVPALALCVPSGYSYGAGLLLLLTLFAWRQVHKWPATAEGRWLMLAIALMGFLQCLEMDLNLARTMEMPGKYLAALLCLGFVATYRPSAAAWSSGVLVGAAASGLLAVIQVVLLYKQRAGGFTNEIQYGNLSLLLGTLALVVLLVRGRDWGLGLRLAAVMAFALGLIGSLLSQSRGGWLSLLLVVPLGLWLLRDRLHGVRVWTALGLGGVLLVAAAWPFRAELNARMDEAAREVRAYQAQGQANSSVGQRLAHWRLAWDMGADSPWVGWGGQAGYNIEKQKRVASGAHPEILMRFTHAHNEWLDQFAKRGLLGVTILALFYAIPLAVFWPTKRRMARVGALSALDVYTARLSAVFLVVSYIGFGMTQVFFSHNSGHMFYLFPLILLYGMLNTSSGGRPVGQRVDAATRR